MSELSFDAPALVSRLAGTPLAPWADALADAVLNQGHALKHGHLDAWEKALDTLPVVEQASWSIIDGTMTIAGEFPNAQQSTLADSLAALSPWRKGPYRIGSIDIDTEWRSDWKWDRMEAFMQPLLDQLVLDVGCGSGYHLWRMRDAGARQILGIDPSLLYLKQFDAIQHFVDDPAVLLLPLTMEALPSSMRVFDTVFSMGVLYHRRNPMDHLNELRQAMTAGGNLVLETLVIPDSRDTSLAITERYANMRNIYELPSVKRLEAWVRAAGYDNVRTVSVAETSRGEQRSTPWMTSHSLAQALDPDDSSLTVEGYPRPLRAVVLASGT